MQLCLLPNNIGKLLCRISIFSSFCYRTDKHPPCLRDGKTVTPNPVIFKVRYVSTSSLAESLRDGNKQDSPQTNTNTPRI